MSDETTREVYRAHRDAQSRYTYFLLAAAGAAIALAVRQTQGDAATWHHIPLAAAVLCWGFSFFSGCRYLSFMKAVLSANLDLLRVESGQDPEVGPGAPEIAVASAKIRQDLKSDISRAGPWSRWHFRLLVAGGVLYVCWHVLEMCLRTASVA